MPSRAYLARPSSAWTSASKIESTAEEEHRQDRRHDDDHHAGHHRLASGRPDDLGGLGADLLDEFEGGRLGHSRFALAIARAGKIRPPPGMSRRPLSRDRGNRSAHPRCRMDAADSGGRTAWQGTPAVAWIGAGAGGGARAGRAKGWDRERAGGQLMLQIAPPLGSRRGIGMSLDALPIAYADRWPRSAPRLGTGDATRRAAHHVCGSLPPLGRRGAEQGMPPDAPPITLAGRSMTVCLDAPPPELFPFAAPHIGDAPDGTDNDDRRDDRKRDRQPLMVFHDSLVIKRSRRGPAQIPAKLSQSDVSGN